MPVQLNLRHLEANPVTLSGELAPGELGLEDLDDLMRPQGNLEYEVTAESQEGGVLLQGTLRMNLGCECARCLQPFVLKLHLENWACLVALQGEDAAEIRGDCVDLTPYFREDMVLALPQRPLCNPDCGGLKQGPLGTSHSSDTASSPVGSSPVWRELDKLRL